MKANEAPETYPIQFRDKIDEYLWKEHHILGGCCSSIESVKYIIAREVVEKLTDAFIEKAVSYLNSKLYDWVQTTNPNQRSYANTIMKQDFIEDFRKYMKGE